MDTATLAVMISHATLGFGLIGLMWSALEKRMDSIHRQIEADRAHRDKQHS